jgi:hypothetical protein
MLHAPIAGCLDLEQRFAAEANSEGSVVALKWPCVTVAWPWVTEQQPMKSGATIVYWLDECKNSDSSQL